MTSECISRLRKNKQGEAKGNDKEANVCIFLLEVQEDVVDRKTFMLLQLQHL